MWAALNCAAKKHTKKLPQIGSAALAAAVLLTAQPSHAGLVEDLVAKSTANLELNNAKVRARAHFERIRNLWLPV